MCACGGRPPAPPAPVPETFTELEQEVHGLVNLYRAREGLARLGYDLRLAEIAREHSRDMAGGIATFSHDGLSERVRRAAVRDRQLDPHLGENLFAMQPASLVATWRAVMGWLKSPAHREIIVGCFNASGVGIAVSAEGMIYITQLFAVSSRISRPSCE